MPTVSLANFESDDLLSSRLLSFMTSNDQMNTGCEASATNGAKFTSSGSFGSCINSPSDVDINGRNCIRSPLHRTGANVATLHDRLYNGSSSDITTANSTGFVSGSCTPPLSSGHLTTTVPPSYLPLRNHSGAPPYSALTSPCLTNKLNPGGGVPQMLGYSNCNVPTECHSLQNSPFYNHYPVNGNIPAQLHRQLGGISPGPMGPLIPNGVSPLPGNSRTGLYQDLAFPLNGSIRTLVPGNGSCPQRELFPAANQNGTQCGSSIFGSGLLIQDRLHYYALAQKHGFIVGAELERVKENSCRSTSQSYGRIAAHFRHRYGETEAKTKATYLQIGVRVPSKDHVSEIVGKGGQKIKLIREETGALITTPGEHEEHVFIIEAPPEIAMRVAHHLTARAQEITQSKLAAGERRRGSTSSQPPNGIESNGLSSSSFQNNLNSSSILSAGSTNSLLTINSNGVSSSSTVMSLCSSATSSPLHPTAGVLPATSGNNSVLRTSNIGLFSPQLSSLPSSPCSSGLNNAGGAGISGHSSQPNGGSGSLFLGSNTSGSRVLLARSRISVPQDMVGKIIGTQGSIITTIQKDTGTEIKSPPKEAARGPNATSEFEISAYQGLGLSSNQAAECRVQQAKQLIGHLVMRQLERRASEEVDETSGSSNHNSDEQRHGTGGPSSSSKSNTATWMWPDVAQMDSQEAREVLDRILAESKNKTRRAKELAAAAAVSTGPSPNAGCQSGSMLNMSSSLVAQTVGILNAEQHLLGNNALYEAIDANECPDLSSRDLAHSLSSEMNTTGLFSPHTNHFAKRNPSTTLIDDNGFNRGGAPQPCSPRTLAGFNISDPSELLGSFHRVHGSSNRATDIWNSASTFVAPTGSPIRHNYLNSGSTLSNQFHTSPPAVACGASDATMLRKQTSLTNGFVDLKTGFDEPNIFNFSDTGNGLSSGFASGGDVSPTMLMQTSGRNLPQPDLVHQPLTRRHSDWVASSANMLMMDIPNSRSGRPVAAVSGTNGGFLSLETACEATPNVFSSSGGFDFLKALDQLCLSSGSDNLNVESISSQSNSASSRTAANSLSLLSSHCPPGFESLPPSSLGSVTAFISDKAEGVSDLHELCTTNSLTTGPWSNSTDSSNGVSLFMSSEHSPSDSLHSNSVSKLSVLQRLFHNSNQLDTDLISRTTTTAHLNSIWSPSIDCSNPDIPQHDSSDHAQSYQFTPYFDALHAANLLNSVEEPLISKTEPTNMFNCPGSSEAIHNGGSSGDLSSRCGTIGEGRRRRHGQSPISLSNELDSMIPISVSSVITSITEVA